MSWDGVRNYVRRQLDIARVTGFLLFPIKKFGDTWPRHVLPEALEVAGSLTEEEVIELIRHLAGFPLSEINTPDRMEKHLPDCLTEIYMA